MASCPNPVSTLKSSERSAPISSSAVSSPEVLVQAGGLRVVVAGADVAVALEALTLAAHHQGHLGVGLESGDAVHDMNPGLFEESCPGEVGLLVEPGLEFDQDHDLLAGPRCGDQRLDDGLLTTQRPDRRAWRCGTGSA